MKNRIFGHAIVIVCITALMTATTSVKAFASESNNTQAEVALSSSNQIQLPADNHLINTQIMPGDKIQQAFYVNNKSSQTVSFYMSGNMEIKDAAGNPIVKVDGKTFAEDLVRKIQLTIAKEDGTILYQGPCSGDIQDANEKYKANFATATISDGLLKFNTKTGIGLGSLNAGTSMRLIATLDVPGASIGNEYQNAYSIFNWEFYCQGEDAQGPYYPPVISPVVSPGVSPVVSPSVPTDIPDEGVPGDEGQGDGQQGDEDDSTSTIEDEEVPLDDIPVVVDDKDIEGSLAKTGFSVLYIKQAISVLIVLFIGLIVVNKLRKKKNV